MREVKYSTAPFTFGDHLYFKSISDLTQAAHYQAVLGLLKRRTDLTEVEILDLTMEELATVTGKVAEAIQQALALEGLSKQLGDTLP